MRKHRIAMLLTCALIATGCAGGDAAIITASQDDVGFGAATQQGALAFADDSANVPAPNPSDLAAGEPLSGDQDIAGPDAVAGPTSGQAEEAGSDTSTDSTSSTAAPQDDGTTTSSTQNQGTTSSTSANNSTSTTTTTRAPSTTSTTRAPSTTSTTRAPTTTSTTTTAAPTTTTTTSTTTTSTTTTTTTTTPPIDGGAIFQARCASCHNDNGDGFGDTALNIQGLPTEFVVPIVTNGAPGGMPSFGGLLTPEEIDAVAAYVRTLPNS